MASLFRNSSVSLGAEANYYSGNAGFGAEIAFDKWVVSTVAVRGQLDVNFASGSSSSMVPFYYGHADMLFDLYSSLLGRNPSNSLRSYLMLGGGLVHKKGDNDFCILAGVGCQYRVSNDWRLYAELGTTVHPSDFDGKDSPSLMTALSLGVVYDINNNPTRSRSRFETLRFANDWFFNVSFGTASVNYSEISSFGQRVSLLTPVFEFGLGKRLTTLWQIRLCVSGLYARTVDDMFSYYNLRGDIMIDPVAYFSTENPHPQFSVCPYLSAGVVARLDDQANFLACPAGGAQLVWRFDRRNQVYLDARYVVTPLRFVQSSVSERIGKVGLATLLVGYSHTFSKVSFR